MSEEKQSLNQTQRYILQVLQEVVQVLEELKKIGRAHV